MIDTSNEATPMLTILGPSVKSVPSAVEKILFACGMLSLAFFLTADLAAQELRVDLGSPAGTFRALHGLNKGPLSPGGLIDLTESIRDLRPPSIRLHDCHWPYPDVVDIHTIFPRFEADPRVPAHYDFARTDAYLEAVRRTGADMVYRLGESIEHDPTKKHVHPPKDADQWAAIGLGIIRHYNEGWAGGHRWNIRYWEIWNEPENRPAMWTGTDEDYFRLYRATARAIKTRYPHLKVGGPAVGHSGDWKDGVFRPSAFVIRFLSFCREQSLPLDFFSWHGYTADPSEYSRKARALRRLLDDFGFTATESHLNEWNYLPNFFTGNWEGLACSTNTECPRPITPP